MDRAIGEPQPASIAIRYPVTVDGVTHSTLTMRPPRARDSRDAQRGGGASADIEIRMFANLCEVAPAAIEELHMVDYQQLQAAFEGFLS